MKYLFAILLLAGCSSTPPTGGEWATIWGDNKLPLGSYNAKSDEAIFYGSPSGAFKQLMKMVIASEQARQAAAKPAPAPAKKK